ncbi:MAG: hypothetical protein Q8936_25055 [Bacillota bacterium]|nr:hypothetical protein [Bacillota bacterium]
MVIGLLILIPVIAITTGYFTLKAYQLGLKHNYELKHEEKPTIKENPLQEFFDNKAEAKQAQEQASMIDEWLHGAKE